jgi:DNA-binding transcriptional ArsR family regulator
MDMFSAIAEPTRRNILELLATNGQMSAGEIYKKFKTTPPAISQHLKILHNADLVSMEKKAQLHLYKINPSAVDEIDEWLEKLRKVWDARFDRLEKVLGEEKKLSSVKSASGGRIGVRKK